MKNSTKIWICITGVLLVVLGIVCICHPAATLFSTAWLIGLFTLLAGITELVFTINTQAFLPNSGTRMLSAILNIVLGFIFLGNTLFLGASLPYIFAFWVIVEGILVAVRSFDYKQVGFGGWWGMLLMGIAAVVLGVLGLRNPDITGKTLSTLIGLGIVFAGAAYLVALGGINRFEKKVKEVKGAIRDLVDEQ